MYFFNGNFSSKFIQVKLSQMKLPASSFLLMMKRAIFNSIVKSINQKPTKLHEEESSRDFWSRLRCPNCPEEGNVGRLSPPMIANQVKRQAEGFISMYYRGVMMCDDETCKCTTQVSTSSLLVILRLE
ncbi:DNA polymerase alpha catalytic subunit-like [Argentina anserina]|uniref:DNA polymerase alpha catalytic subunit-like n=1 Tax=Argentina anserina TaxID=57926 RepID=UPI0021768176|nr:DNA polymerase alpha catalytic subunit-like [Potentilla anserina]